MADLIANGESGASVRAKLNTMAATLTADADAVALSDAMTTPASVPGFYRYNALIKALKDGGVWPLLTHLSVQVAETDQASLIDLTDPSVVATLSGSPVFTKWGGRAVSSTAKIDTGRVVNTLISQNSAMVGVYNLQDSSDSATLHNAANSTIRITSRNGSNQLGARLNAESGATASATQTDCRGLTVVQRQSESHVSFWVNGEKFGTDVASTSTTPASDNLMAGLSTSAFSIGAIVAGAPLTDVQHAALYAALRDYMASVGAWANYWPNPVTLTMSSSFVVPNISGSDPANSSFTPTGLAVDRINNLLIVGDFGQYGTYLTPTHDATNTRPGINVLSMAGALVGRIGFYEHYGTTDGIQATDVGPDGHYWGARPSANMVTKVSPDGLTWVDFAWSRDNGPNGFAIDTLRNVGYVSGNTAIDTIYIVELTDFSELGTIVLPNNNTSDTIDHLSYDPDRDELIITKGSNNAEGRLLIWSLARNAPAGMFIAPSGTAIEGAVAIGDNILIANDAKYHAVPDNTNTIQTYERP